MNSWNNGGGNDDQPFNDADDNIGNRADGPPTHDGPRPPRFAGEGQSRRQRLGISHDRPRRDRGGYGGQRREPDGNVAPPGHFSGAPGGDPQPRFDQAPRPDQGPRPDQAPRSDQGPRDDRGPRRRRGRRGGGGGGNQGNYQGGGQGSGQPGFQGAPQAAPVGDAGGQQFDRGPRPFNERGGRRGDRGPRPPRDQQQQQQSPRDDRPRGGIREDETKVYGVNACDSVFQKRPESIIRAYVDNEMLRRFGYTMKFLAEHRRAYHVVGDDELRRVTGSEHHGGVCFVIRKRVPLDLLGFLQLYGEQPQCRVLLLEGVGNPHNIGAVLRSCAHFGVDAVLVEDAGYAQGGSAARVAEGAAESVRLVQFRGTARALEVLRQAGFARVVTSSHATQSCYEATLPEKAVFVFGAEGTGVSAEAADHSDLKFTIPGSGAVESLNVSVAAGVVLSELYRRHGLAGQAEPVPNQRQWVLPPEDPLPEPIPMDASMDAPMQVSEAPQAFEAERQFGDESQPQFDAPASDEPPPQD